jgi:membrane protein implicated in regulation of membrane protease activity
MEVHTFTPSVKGIAMDERSSSAFGLYESLRILIPGFYFATLCFFFYWCFLSLYAGSMESAFPVVLLFLFLSVVSGLTMYAKETAKRRRAFLENQPSTFLKERAKLLKNTVLLDDTSARKLYFYILNNNVPRSFHDKIFFFGTIYHIMILLRRTTFWFALAAIAGILVRVAAAHPLADQASSVVFAASVLLIYLLNVRYNKADRKMQENYQDQIFWLEMNHEIVEDTIRQYSRSRTAISK